VLTKTYWYDLVKTQRGEPEQRYGPFESEEEAIKWLEHEQMEGSFDIVKYVSTYKE
jgi:hypothetical protein